MPAPRCARWNRVSASIKTNGPVRRKRITSSRKIPETMGKWLKANSWYQSGQNPRAARLAAELFEDIRQDGFDPNDAPAPYAELNKAHPVGDPPGG